MYVWEDVASRAEGKGEEGMPVTEKREGRCVVGRVEERYRADVTGGGLRGLYAGGDGEREGIGTGGRGRRKEDAGEGKISRVLMVGREVR